MSKKLDELLQIQLLFHETKNNKNTAFQFTFESTNKKSVTISAR